MFSLFFGRIVEIKIFIYDIIYEREELIKFRRKQRTKRKFVRKYENILRRVSEKYNKQVENIICSGGIVDDAAFMCKCD